jgi:hypothetical protein
MRTPTAPLLALLLLLLLAPAVSAANYPMEVEQGNATSYGDIAAMWRNAGAVGVWHFADSATQSTDSADYNNITWLTAANAPSRTTGKIGYALNIQGAGGAGNHKGAIKSSPTGLPSGTQANSQLMWVYPTGWGDNNIKYYAGFGQEAVTYKLNGVGFDGTTHVIQSIGWGNEVTAATAYSLNNWQFGAFTYNGTGANLRKLYANKTLDYVGTATSAINNVQITLGYTTSATQQQSIGNLDEYRIYNYALSWAEINATQENIAGTAGYGTLGAFTAASYDNGFSNCALINNTFINAGTPIVVNGSNGITINGNIQIIWTTANASRYFCYNSSSVYGITDNINITAAPVGSNIVWLSQTPAQLTSTNIIAQRLKIQYNITNITSGTPYLSYKVNNSLSDISVFINGTGTGGYKTTTGTNVSNLFNFTLDDNQVLPGTYTLDYSLFRNTSHSFTSISSNSYLSTELFNVSNQTPYNFYEFMANGTGTNNIISYYCNSSYGFNQAPGSNTNCALIGNMPNNQTYDHSHSINSSHHYLPFSINTTTGTFGSTGVKVTGQSFFIIRGAQTAGTAVYTIPIGARANTTRLSTNSGNSYTPAASTSVDTHIHQFTADETIYYQAYANVSGALNNSSLTSQIYGLTNVPPTAPVVLTPTSGLQYGTINITWLASQNLTPSTIYYNVSLLNTDLTFNKTILANTSNLSYSWNSAGTPQANYVIRVKAIDNYTLSAFDDSVEFTLATFNASLLLPSNAVILEGNSTLFTYSTNNIITPATCSIYLDTVAIYSAGNLNNATSHYATVGQGSHTWYVSCISDDALFTYTTASRTFSMNYSSFNFLINLSATQQNVFSQPQLLFYDVSGYLNVLYFTDEVAGNTLRVAQLNGSNIVANYSLLYADTPLIFATVLREANKTIIYGLTTAAPSTSLIITLNGSLSATTGSFPYNSVVKDNGYYDAYTYAGTAHYQTLSLTPQSQYFTMVPIANGSGYFTINATSNAVAQVGAQLPANIAAAWQTMANDSALTTWYYLGTGGTNISLSYYNGTRNKLIELDSGYTGAELNASIGNFYEYGGTKYVVLANLTNTTIYQINGNLSYKFAEKLANPSFLYFVDKDTFLFFNTVGATTSAYSCYFATVGNCTKLTAAEYGFSMPYVRGRMATMKREGNSDVVAQGVISAGDTTALLYSQYTYDGKYLCYDEMAETRKLFKVNIYTETTANQLSNNSWGYVIPSSILGSGFKKAYFTCWNGTQRLFLAGLNSNFTINSYSLEVPKGVYYTFQALNQYNIPVQNATITAFRFAPSKAAFVPIEQGISDFNGNAIFYLEPYQFYKFVVEANGYIVLTFDLTPGADTVLEFKLSQSGGTVLVIPTYERVFNDVSYSLTPATTYQNQSFNITYTISSGAAELTYYCMNVTREWNGTTGLVYNATGTAAGGGILQYTATLNGTYRVNTCFKHQNYTLYAPPLVTYYLSPKQGLTNVRDRLPGMMGGWAYFMIATVIALIVAGYISRFTIDGAGLMGLMVLWFFTAMNPGAVIIGAAGCTLGTLGCITITMATGLTSIIVIGGLLWKQFG